MSNLFRRSAILDVVLVDLGLRGASDHRDCGVCELLVQYFL